MPEKDDYYVEILNEDIESLGEIDEDLDEEEEKERIEKNIIARADSSSD